MSSKVKIGDFLFERKGRYKPDSEEIQGLKRLEKIDFQGNIYLGTKSSKTNMILVKKGDLVISGINVSKGAMSIYLGDEDIVATIHYSSYTFDENKINLEYFKIFLKSPEFIKLLSEQVRGGIKTEIKPKHILPLEINLPSLLEQEKIVSKFNNIELEIKELNQEIEDQEIYLKELRQSILQDAIEGKLTAKWREENPNVESAKKLLEKIALEKEQLIKEKKIRKQKPLSPISDDEIPFDIPNNWEWCRWGNMLSFEVHSMKRGPFGSSLTKDMFVKKGVKVYEQQNAIHDVDRERYFISEEKFEEMKAFIVKPGDLIISCSGATLGRISELHNNSKTGIINQALLKINLHKHLVSNQYFIKVFRSPLFQSIILKKAWGSAIPNMVGVKELKNIPIALPAIEEQKQIVKEIEKLFKICDKLEEQISKNKLYAEQLMQAILKEAFEDKTQKDDSPKKRIDKKVEISEDEIKQIFEECFIDKKVAIRRRQQSNNHYMSKMIISDNLYGKSKNIRHIELKKLLSKLYSRGLEGAGVFSLSFLPVFGQYLGAILAGYFLYEDIDELSTIKITPEQSLCLIVLNFYTYQLNSGVGATIKEILEALKTSYKKYVDKYKLDEQEIENILKYLQSIHLVENKENKWIVKEEVKREFK